MATTIDIRDQVSAALKALPRELSAAQLNPAISRAEVVMFQKHLIANPSNRYGWPSTNFWPDAARSTNSRILADAVVVSINKQGVNQRYQGGTIKPTGGKKYLTIPARAESYGKRAGEFSDLRLAFHRENGAVRAWALVQAEHTTVKFGRRRRDGSQPVTKEEVGGAVMFWLVESVTQRGNPAVIPSDEQIATTAMTAVNAAVERALRRAGKG